MSVVNALLDNLGGVFNPKGNLADWRHGARTFIDNGYRLAPKSKFLYHVSFTFSLAALGQFPKFNQIGKLETGILVKQADLPKYTATTETLKQYNKVNYVHTGINYDPITITFYDDNLGLTSELMEMYYRFYFNDGNYVLNNAAYNKGAAADMFRLQESEHFNYGVRSDQNTNFFDKIEISQLTRGDYTTFTLVNPIVEAFGHSDVAYADAGGTTENRMTVKYEAVWYTRGKIAVGANGNPKNFGAIGYDNVPSPISLLGGGAINALGLGTAVGDLIGNADSRNPLATALGAVNLIGNVQKIGVSGAIEQIGGGVIGQLEQGSGVGGLVGGIIPGL